MIIHIRCSSLKYHKKIIVMRNQVKLILSIVLCSISQVFYGQEIRSQLKVTDSVYVLAKHEAFEPMLVEHPNGDLYVAGYANETKEPQLWKSTNRGQSWEKIYVGKYEEGADGNSDVDLAIDPSGNIYFMVMKFTQVPNDTTGFDWDSMKGEHIAIGVSKDQGATWKWQYLSKNDYDDRPWVVVASDGSLHAVWNDGKGVHHRTSNNQGDTWEKRPDISSKGGSSHFTAGPNGLLAMRISPESASGLVFDKEVDLIRLSTDFGKSWKDVSVPGNRDWQPFGSSNNEGIHYWVEPISFDSKGNLYYLWSEGKILKLGISKNLGDDWTIHDLYTSENNSFFPFIQIKDGHITCTWLSEYRNMEKMEYKVWHHVVDVYVTSDGIKTSFLEPMYLIDELNYKYQEKVYSNYGGEYFPAITLLDGTIGVVTTLSDSKTKRKGFTWRKLEIDKKD